MAREEESTGEERRAARRRNTRQRILDTTLDILVRDGYEGFTIARLASELDYAVGALYRYFKGKDAIVAALQHQIVTRLEAELDAVLRVLPDDSKQHALQRLFVAGIVYESLTWRRPTEHQVLAHSLGDPRPQLKKEEVESVLSALESLLGRLAEVIASATKLGALGPGDARHQALIFWGSTYGIMALRKLERMRPDFADTKLVKSLHTALVIGWGAAPTDAERAFDEAATLVRDTFSAES
ncbi:MAG: AcrR family transcriptional regulator [Polyangiales bacterium]|jgi:AcrR family transcriptional regulator